MIIGEFHFVRDKKSLLTNLLITTKKYCHEKQSKNIIQYRQYQQRSKQIAMTTVLPTEVIICYQPKARNSNFN